MSKGKSDISDTPGLEDIGDLFPPSPSVSPIPNISLKLPAFWLDAADVWFTQADAQFVIKSISVSKTKFYHAVADKLYQSRVSSSSVNLLSEFAEESLQVNTITS